MTSLFCKGTKGWVTWLGLHRKPVMHPGANVPMSAGTGTATGCTGFWGRIWTQTCTSLLPPGPPGMCPPMLCSKCRASQARLSQVNLCDEHTSVGAKCCIPSLFIQRWCRLQSALGTEILAVSETLVVLALQHYWSDPTHCLTSRCSCLLF